MFSVLLFSTPAYADRVHRFRGGVFSVCRAMHDLLSVVPFGRAGEEVKMKMFYSVVFGNHLLVIPVNVEQCPFLCCCCCYYYYYY